MALPTTLKDRYIVKRRIAALGETIVYAGYDAAEKKAITVREFFLPGFQERGPDGCISMTAGSEVIFKSLSLDFEEQNQKLMDMSKTKGIISPADIFSANNTVYTVEPLVQFPTLNDYLAKNSTKISWTKLKKAMAPMVAALIKLHSQGIIHRGISPETVLVDDEGRLVLTGFCIAPARTVGSEIPASLYFGYSAPEQYHSTSWQGEWTDVYSLACLCYRALTLATPLEFRQRGGSNSFAEPRKLNPRVPKNVSQAIMKGMAIELSRRFRNIEEFWAALTSRPENTAAATSSMPRTGVFKSRKTAFVWGAGVLLVVLTILSLSTGLLRILIGAPENSLPPEQPNQAAAPPEQSKTQDNAGTQNTVPNFVGMSLEKILVDPAFRRDFIFEPVFSYSETTPVGIVIGQDPPFGHIMGENGTIIMTVSRGSAKVAMPDILGLPREKALNILREAEINFETQQKYVSGAQADTVVLTTPAPGGIIYKNADRAVVVIASDDLQDS